ncbi:unnamed protein product [Arctia plantaginis]|uniref:CHK kinase-like domain-containing protein n=1 Tax=Arctia plantaginis TaxID=874455 RepID=A0A8S1AGD3_ARCPL|nr:unnamed protein product [Arctia plantaginis]
MTGVEEMLYTFLPKIAEEQKYVDYKLKIEPISSGGANYTSTLYNVTIEERNNTHHMFVKVAAMGEKIRSQTPNFYHTEIFVYTKLAKVYKNLEEEHQVPDKYRLHLTKFYGCDPTVYKETVVLENLVVKGYQPYDRLKPIDWEYAASAITELTKLHALSFAYSEYHPEEYKKVVNDHKFVLEMEAEFVSGFFDASIAKAIDSVEEKFKDKLKVFFERFVKKFPDLFKGVKPVLIHGDYRPSNLMHRNANETAVDVMIVDLQTLQGASPVVDLLYFIFTGSDEEFRAEYYDKLIDHYYTELEAAMKRLHLDPEKIYSRAVFDKELKEKLPFGLTISVFALPVVTVSAEHAPKVDADMELSAFCAEKASDLYVERLNGVVNDFMKWGLLK